jgi:hypothetical protein
MTQQPQPTRASSARTGSRIALAIAALAVLGAGAWWFGRPPAPEVTAPGPAVQASQAPASAASAQAVSMAASAAPASSAATGASAPPPNHEAMARKAWEQSRSPAEALRKVQVALGGGTPQEMLEAAQMLQACSTMAGAPEALHAVRDRPTEAPAPVRKMLDDMGGVTNEMIENAQREARRCQVFDAATMARRKELFHRAWEGGAEGGAAAYLNALQNPMEKADPALVASLQADVRKAAAAGDADALLHVATATGDSARELGVTPVQRAGYKAAWRAIQDERFPGAGIGALLEKSLAPFDQAKPAKPLTAAEQAQADALAQQVLEAWRRKRQGG